MPGDDDFPDPFDGREWLFFALGAAVLGTIAAASASLFLRAGGLEALFHTPFPSPSDYELTVRDQLTQLWDETVFLATTGFYLLWGSLTLGVALLAAFCVLATVWVAFLERVIRTLDRYGVETPIGRPTLADVAILALVSAVPAVGVWYTQPFGPLEAFVRSVAAVITVIVVVACWLAVDALLERIGDWFRANARFLAPRKRDE